MRKPTIIVLTRSDTNRSARVPTIYVLSKNKLLKIFHFYKEKISVYCMEKISVYCMEKISVYCMGVFSLCHQETNDMRLCVRKPTIWVPTRSDTNQKKAVTAKLICVFVFAHANCWFSHAQAHITF